MIRLDLPRGVKYEADKSVLMVITTLPDGRQCYATRGPTFENVNEARRQGYVDGTGGEACWRSLVEHELLHSIAADVLWEHEHWGHGKQWCGISPVLMHEATSGTVSGTPTPYDARLFEEGVTIGLQMHNGIRRAPQLWLVDERYHMRLINHANHWLAVVRAELHREGYP